MVQQTGSTGKRVVVVTGASAGVGRATAKEFAKHGWHVALIARPNEALENAAREVDRLGGRALVIPADVADADAVEAAAEEVEREFGPIDVWVNNAMTTVFARFDDVTPEEYRRATEVTYLGVVWGTMSALRRMKARNRGTIVQVGSALAYRAIPLQAPYCGAKHAIRGFTDSIRSELIHDKVDVHLTMVQLPGLNTPQFSWCKAKLPRHPQPVPPIFQPEVAAEGVYWAATHRRREISVGLNTAVIIFGNHFLPGFGDRYLARNAVDGQQMDRPIDPNRPSNLFEAVPGDFGTRGEFTSKAKARSYYLWASMYRGMAGAAAVSILLLLAIVIGLML